jgi:5,10-methylenetetrahydromethanopterin reductase
MPSEHAPKVGLLFSGGPSVPEMVRLSQHAEGSGFDSVWVAETRMTRDGLTPVAAIAAQTNHIRVGTGIVNVFTRNPVLMAVSFASLEELAPGRILMGLGTGSPKVLAPQGVPFDLPLTRLREYVNVITRLVRGEEVTFAGETVNVTETRIEDLLSADEAGTRNGLPLYLGTTGVKALEFAGEVADGVLMNGCLSTEYVANRMELIERGARKVGRTLDQIELAMSIVVSPHEDGQVGRDGARRFVTLYLAMMPNIAKESGVPADQLETIRSTYERHGLERAMELVDDEIVCRLSAAGTPAECRAKLDEYRAAGIGLTVLTAPGPEIERAIDLLGPALATAAA